MSSPSSSNRSRASTAPRTPTQSRLGSYSSSSSSRPSTSSSSLTLNNWRDNEYSSSSPEPMFLNGFYTPVSSPSPTPAGTGRDYDGILYRRAHNTGRVASGANTPDSSSSRPPSGAKSRASSASSSSSKEAGMSFRPESRKNPKATDLNGNSNRSIFPPIRGAFPRPSSPPAARGGVQTPRPPPTNPPSNRRPNRRPNSKSPKPPAGAK